jgi:uncharacterized protein YrrD
MINYARHDEEFYGIFKLLNGEEVLGKAVLTEDDGETLAFVQDPVCINLITKEVGEHKIVRGMGFSKWMQLSDEEFFILREKDILTVASMSKEISILYDAYIISESTSSEKMTEMQTDVKSTAGYLGTIDDARSLFERIFKS